MISYNFVHLPKDILFPSLQLDEQPRPTKDQKHISNAIRNGNWQSYFQATIILDKNFTVKYFSAQVPILLGYGPNKLLGLGFHEILSKQSIPL